MSRRRGGGAAAKKLKTEAPSLLLQEFTEAQQRLATDVDPEGGVNQHRPLAAFPEGARVVTPGPPGNHRGAVSLLSLLSPPRLLLPLISVSPALLAPPSGGAAVRVGEGGGARSGLINSSFRVCFASGANGLMPFSRSFRGWLASGTARWSPYVLGGSPWWRRQGCCGSDTSFLNKLVVCILFIFSVLVLILLPAGLGGERKKMVSAANGGAGGWHGGSVDLARRRGAGRWWIPLSAVLLRWKIAEHAVEPASFNKRWHLSICSAVLLILLLAVHGGEGKEKLGVVAASSGGGCSTIENKEQDFQSLCCTMVTLPDGDFAEEAVLLLFGFFHRMWTTTHLLLIPRFNSGDILRLSSVMVHKYLQLNSSQPQVHTPDRPSGEPTAGHQLVWSTEALGDCGCSILESGLSTDDRSLFGSIGNLRFLHVLYKCRPSYTCSVQIGTSVSCSVLESIVSLYCEL